MTRKRTLIIAALLGAVAVSLGFAWPFSGGPQTLRLPGIVENQQVRLASKVGGRVDRVAVEEGQVVAAGQALVYIDLPELRTQREQHYAKLQAARADLERAHNGARPQEKAAAKAAVKAAEARYRRLKAGTRKEELAQARAELDSAKADLVQAEQDLERTAQLRRGNAESRAAHDAAVAARGRLEGRVNAASARLDLLVAGPRQEEIDEAAAELARARENSDLLEAGTRPEEVKAAEARVAELEGRLREIDVNLAEGVVVAPERAVVEVLPIRKGDVVNANQPVARVLRAADLWVKVFVPETELGKVRLGQEVKVSIDAYPGKEFRGTVQHIAGVSEFTPRNVQSVSERRHQVFAVKVRVADPQGAFHSGMAAEVVLPLHD